MRHSHRHHLARLPRRSLCPRRAALTRTPQSSTPTFCGTYTRKCTTEEFASLRYVLVGAEKLRQPVADAFRKKFGVQLLEGYGCTEMSPVVAVNAPDFSAGRDTQTGSKPGTAGHPLPRSRRAQCFANFRTSYVRNFSSVRGL
jgi:acyl-CoA synthetase (AMP-forming)/AMP-acid ligase II